MVTDFKQAVESVNPELLRVDRLKTLQVNLGNRCNQRCVHCHVQAGPDGQKLMRRAVMNMIIEFLRRHRHLTVDITGGCPEMNPDFKFFIENVCKLASKVMVRTNLTIFFENGFGWLPEWYRDHHVVVVGSLPCYTEQNVDKQRGTGVFRKSIEALRLLNRLGYGCNGNGLELDLVYNPGGPFLPAPQEQLQADYAQVLNENYGVRFNSLFTITNAPIGRFGQSLRSGGQFEEYLQLLMENFNPEVVEYIMCRTLVSVDHKGIVYNCDFNQALGLPIIDTAGNSVMIDQLDEVLCEGIEIITDRHCFCCTAGAGSGCTGSMLRRAQLTKE